MFGTEVAKGDGGALLIMENPKNRAYTKRRLVKELAFRAGITQNQAKEALEAIIEIAYREAKANQFILPGLCKFDVVRRRARNVRNPITGEALVLPERDALHVVLSKRAKEAVAPRVAPMKPDEYAAFQAEAEKAAAEQARTEQAEAERVAAEQAETTKTAEEKPEAEAAESAAVPEAIQEDVAPEAAGAEAISFFCPTCGQEVVASGETVGCEAECPTCGAILKVPAESAPGSTYGTQGESDAPKKEIIAESEVEDMNPQALKNRTIRIDALMFSDDGKLITPNEQNPQMTAAMKSRTMRIDLPDEF